MGVQSVWKVICAPGTHEEITHYCNDYCCSITIILIFRTDIAITFFITNIAILIKKTVIAGSTNITILERHLSHCLLASRSNRGGNRLPDLDSLELLKSHLSR